jgi:hypothetical protein
MGYVDPVQVIPSPSNDALYLQALGAALEMRTPSNLREFVRPPMRDLVRIRVYAFPLGRDYRSSEAFSGSFARKRDGLMAPLRLPEIHGLEHWSNNYKHPLAQPYKPCERKDEGNGCGQYSQDDIYRPLKSGATTMIQCSSHLFVDHGTSEMAMSPPDREAYYASNAYRNPGWRQRTNPHCSQEIYYAPLNATVAVRYRSGLLPHWQALERRTVQILDEALAAASRSQ